MVQNRQIPNCLITIQDIKNAEYIWGLNLGSLKRKKVSKQLLPVRTQVHNIFIYIMKQYWDVTLSVDIMKVNNILFLTTISWHIEFSTAGKFDTMKNAEIVKHFKHVIGIYITWGFCITIILADN